MPNFRQQKDTNQCNRTRPSRFSRALNVQAQRVPANTASNFGQSANFINWSQLIAVNKHGKRLRPLNSADLRRPSLEKMDDNAIKKVVSSFLSESCQTAPTMNKPQANMPTCQ